MSLPFHRREAFYVHGAFQMGRWCGNLFFRVQSPLNHYCLYRLVNVFDVILSNLYEAFYLFLKSLSSEHLFHVVYKFLFIDQNVWNFFVILHQTYISDNSP